MNRLRCHGNRLWRRFRLAVGGVATLVFLLGAQAAWAAPRAWYVSPLGELYEFDVATGDYSLAHTFGPAVRCHQLTRAGDSLFCAHPGLGQSDGTGVRRLELSSASVSWQVSFPGLGSPDGIAYSNSLLYLLAHESQPRRNFLLTLDPATGEVLARIEIPDHGTPSGAIYTMAARGSELWVMVPASGGGIAARRLDPLTGVLHEPVAVPGVPSTTDADFDPFGRLVLSRWSWGPANTHWCTDYWIVPSLGELPSHQFSRCWPPSPGGPPTLAYFTLAEGGSAPVAEIPTLGAASLWVLAALLAMAGVLALRGSGRSSKFKLKETLGLP